MVLDIATEAAGACAEPSSSRGRSRGSGDITAPRRGSVARSPAARRARWRTPWGSCGATCSFPPRRSGRWPSRERCLPTGAPACVCPHRAATAGLRRGGAAGGPRGDALLPGVAFDDVRRVRAKVGKCGYVRADGRRCVAGPIGTAGSCRWACGLPPSRSSPAAAVGSWCRSAPSERARRCVTRYPRRPRSWPGRGPSASRPSGTICPRRSSRASIGWTARAAGGPQGDRRGRRRLLARGRPPRGGAGRRGRARARRRDRRRAVRAHRRRKWSAPATMAPMP